MTATLPASAHHRQAAQAEQIARMFAEGHDLTTVAQQGAVNGWTRSRALQVIEQRGWELDADGRVPRAQRPAVTPGKPLPSAPAGMPGVGTIGGQRPVVERPKPSPGRAQVAALAAQQTPTEKAAAAPSPRGTAPSADAGVMGRRAPDAAPQVSPSRATPGNNGGCGASEAVAAPPAPDLPALTAMATAAQQREADNADALLARAAESESPRVHELADAARLLLDKLRAALDADEQRARLRARLSELDAERAAILAQLEEVGTRPPEQPAVSPKTRPTVRQPIAHGTWGGRVAHQRRGEPTCDACLATSPGKRKKATP